MQVLFEPDEPTFPRVEAAMYAGRIDRYMGVAQKDRKLAFQHYLWNCSLSESFYFPLHMAEIVCRNGIHSALLARGKIDWYAQDTFLKLLDERHKRDLAEAISKEKIQHGSKFSNHHVVSAMTFGFWDHLTTKRFERYIWSKGINHSFPHAPNGKTFEDLHSLIEDVRRWRNRIAHHRAIFDKGPVRKHDAAIELIKWHCTDTAKWVAANSSVMRRIQSRP